jgi:RNA polymerase sigma-54 factor
MDIRLQMKLSQNLVMTPMLQQAIKLLQLSRMELQEMVQQEIMENPVLEETLEENQGNLVKAGRDLVEVGGEAADKSEDSSYQEASSQEIENKRVLEDSEVDWMSMIDTSYAPDDRQWREMPEEGEEGRPMASPVSLSEYLLWQVHISGIPRELDEAAEVIIGNLDDDGYLRTPLSELAAQSGMTAETMEAGLRVVQSLEPTGVAARDLTECLLLQIDAREDAPPLARKILEEQREKLEKRDLTGIADTLGVERQLVRDAVAWITGLDPFPARQYSGRESPTIVPDVVVTKVDDEYLVTLNDEGLPRLRISRYYRELLRGGDDVTPQVKTYLTDRYRSALWLLKSINQRQQTILKVARSIVAFQEEFFDKGIGRLKPLVLRDVADDIGMHESTVSRVTDNKFMATPRGLFPLKFFFHSKVLTEDGKEVSSETVKEKIREIVTKENNDDPLSDQEIGDILFREGGIRIARRTVAKYRQSLRIPSTKERREFI